MDSLNFFFTFMIALSMFSTVVSLYLVPWTMNGFERFVVKVTKVGGC